MRRTIAHGHTFHSGCELETAMQFRLEASRERSVGTASAMNVAAVKVDAESGCVDRLADVRNGSHPSCSVRERFDELVGHQPVPLAFGRRPDSLDLRIDSLVGSSRQPRQPPLGEEPSFGPSQRDGVRLTWVRSTLLGLSMAGRLHMQSGRDAGRARPEHDQRARVDRSCDQVGLAGRGVGRHPRVGSTMAGRPQTVGDQYVERQRCPRRGPWDAPERRTALRSMSLTSTLRPRRLRARRCE